MKFYKLEGFALSKMLLTSVLIVTVLSVSASIVFAVKCVEGCTSITQTPTTQTNQPSSTGQARQSSNQQSGIHAQAPPTSIASVATQASCDSIGGCTTSPFQKFIDNYKTISKIEMSVNFYFNPSLQTNGYNLKDGEVICPGSQLNLENDQVKSEWFGKGGPVDSPPVMFVTEDQLNQIISNVLNYQRTHPFEAVQTTKASTNLPESMSADKNVVGIDMTLYKAPLFSFRRVQQLWAYGNLLCTSESTVQTSAQQNSNNAYSTQDSTVFEVSYQPKCAFYLERFLILESLKNIRDQPVYDILILSDPNQQINLNSNVASQLAVLPNPITHSLALNAKVLFGQPELQIKSVSNVDLNGESGLRFVLQNSGNFDVILEDIIEIPTGLPLILVNNPKLIPANSETEIFAKGASYISLSANQFDVKYRTTDISCLPSKEFSTLRSNAQCISDGQCIGAANVCCGGGCRDPTKGICRDVNGDGLPEWLAYKK